MLHILWMPPESFAWLFITYCLPVTLISGRASRHLSSHGERIEPRLLVIVYFSSSGQRRVYCNSSCARDEQLSLDVFKTHLKTHYAAGFSWAVYFMRIWVCLVFSAALWSVWLIIYKYNVNRYRKGLQTQDCYIKTLHRLTFRRLTCKAAAVPFAVASSKSNLMLYTEVFNSEI